MSRSTPAAERLAAGYIVNAETGCWEWQRYLDKKGYGRLYLNGRQLGAHRASYLIHVGTVPDGLELDHLCRNKKCVNPAHLEPVTSKENHARRPDVRKPHCPRGHAMTPENTYVKDRGGNRVDWNCRTCELTLARERYRRTYERRRISSPLYCQRGHEMFGPMLRIRGGKRACRQCDRDRWRSYAAQRRAGASC